MFGRRNKAHSVRARQAHLGLQQTESRHVSLQPPGKLKLPGETGPKPNQVIQITNSQLVVPIAPLYRSFLSLYTPAQTAEIALALSRTWCRREYRASSVLTQQLSPKGNCQLFLSHFHPKLPTKTARAAGLPTSMTPKAEPYDTDATAELDDAKATLDRPIGANKPWFVYPMLAGAVCSSTTCTIPFLDCCSGRDKVDEERQT